MEEILEKYYKVLNDINLINIELNRHDKELDEIRKTNIEQSKNTKELNENMKALNNNIILFIKIIKTSIFVFIFTGSLMFTLHKIGILDLFDKNKKQLIYHNNKEKEYILKNKKE